MAASKEYKHIDLTEQIIRAFYAVYNTPGYGFLEKVYVNALVLELNKRGLKAIQQAVIKVYYNGQVVGEYFADLVVSDLVMWRLRPSRCCQTNMKHSC